MRGVEEVFHNLKIETETEKEKNSKQYSLVKKLRV